MRRFAWITGRVRCRGLSLKAAAEVAQFWQLTEEDYDDAEKVNAAYLLYFTHVRFRNGWAEPALLRSEVEGPFKEAAGYVLRIRRFLDAQHPSETKLRMVDGAAQAYLHTPAAATDRKAGEATFVQRLVHATFRDATGYVEGLDEQTVDALFHRLQEHRFNPKVHFQHVLSEMATVAERIDLRKVEGARFYVKDGSKDDELWRDAMQKSYQALAVIKEIESRTAKES